MFVMSYPMLFVLIKNMYKNNFILALFSAFFLQACAQEKKDSTLVKKDTLKPIVLNWKEVSNGIFYTETDAPKVSILGDSKLTVFKIDPKKTVFDLHCASAGNKEPRCVDHWSDSLGFQLVFNAGMYDLSKPLVSRGLLKTSTHTNQWEIHPTFNAMLVMQPKDSLKPAVDILDLTTHAYSDFKNDYAVFAQGLRMLDDNGNPIYWKKKAQSCSMMVAAMDSEGFFYVVFTRSPYYQNEMMDFLHAFPVKLRNAIYLEGGPETSVFFHYGATYISKVGSYVSQTYANDKNAVFWPLPNIIGVKSIPLKK